MSREIIIVWRIKTSNRQSAAARVAAASGIYLCGVYVAYSSAKMSVSSVAAACAPDGETPYGGEGDGR